MHESLSAMADIVNPLYKYSTVACDSVEGLIVARASSKGEDDRDFAKVRAVCDDVYATFEVVRDVHKKTRLAIELAASDATSSALEEASGMLKALRVAIQSSLEKWVKAKTILTAIRGVHK